jgi:predicted aminopeptidase
MSSLRARACVLALAAATLSGCYVTRAALHHNDLFNTRCRVDAVLADPETSATTKERLRSVRRILAYAAKSGLKAEGAYDYYIETKEPVVSYIVQAAYPDRLEFYTWWFPVVGSVPYIGYFEKSERDAKAAELEAQGFDVNKAGAGAFSSLGWFEDPIFTSMLNRGEADLAHLFFHELTHRTLWIAGSVEFNENLAEYVASVLTRAYLDDTRQSALRADYEAKLADKTLFRGWLQDVKAALASVYETYKKLPEQRAAAKAAVLDSYQKPPKKPPFKLVDYVADETWNNASILGAALYAPDLERFARAHRCLGKDDAATFLTALTRAAQGAPDAAAAFKALDGLCKGGA